MLCRDLANDEFRRVKAVFVSLNYSELAVRTESNAIASHEKTTITAVCERNVRMK